MQKEKKDIMKIIEKHIADCKKQWVTSCKYHSVEGLAINSSNIYFLLDLQVELDILTPEEYYKELVAFDNWKKEKHLLCLDYSQYSL